MPNDSLAKVKENECVCVCERERERERERKKSLFPLILSHRCERYGLFPSPQVRARKDKRALFLMVDRFTECDWRPFLEALQVFDTAKLDAHLY